MGPHEEFLELGAVSTSGELTEEEKTKLQKHLAGCPQCREALKEFQAAAEISSALFAAEASGELPAKTETRSVEAAQAAFGRRLARENDVTRTESSHPEIVRVRELSEPNGKPYKNAELDCCVPGFAGAATPAYDSSIEALFGREGLKKVMGELTAEQHETLRLHFYEGYTLGGNWQKARAVPGKCSASLLPGAGKTA